ncbi:MAG: hypothetical protein GC178_14000 [Flavobacteriales bacterium]|nr:hypothetical protein [Flavobacteriales bacterium]
MASKDHYRIKQSQLKEAELKSRNTEEVEGFAISSSAIAPSIGESRAGVAYTVDYKDLLRVDTLSPNTLEQAVLRQKHPEYNTNGFPPYYSAASGAMRSSLRNGNHSSALIKINDLKAELVTKQGKAKGRVNANINAIDEFVRLSPINFGVLQNKKAVPSKRGRRFLVIDDFKIVMNPDYIFKAESDGEKIIGGACVLIYKDALLNESRRKLAAFFLKELLIAHYQDEEYRVSAEHCFCIDLAARKRVSAPHNYGEVHKELERVKSRYKLAW